MKYVVLSPENPILEVFTDSVGHPWVFLMDFSKFPAVIPRDLRYLLEMVCPVDILVPSRSTDYIKAMKGQFSCFLRLPGEFYYPSVKEFYRGMVKFVKETRKEEHESVFYSTKSVITPLIKPTSVDEIVERRKARPRGTLEFEHVEEEGKKIPFIKRMLSSAIPDYSSYDMEGMLKEEYVVSERGVLLEEIPASSSDTSCGTRYAYRCLVKSLVYYSEEEPEY
jgi:hypothetical protein